MFPKLRLSLVLVLLVLSSVFVLPLVLQSSPLCPLSVSAQDSSPCLAQQATISAQEVALLKVQLTSNAFEQRSLELQATNSAQAATISAFGLQARIVPVTVEILITATPGPAGPTSQPLDTAYDTNAQATMTALLDGCTFHVLTEGEYPGLIAQEYGVSVFDLVKINGLDEEFSACPRCW